MPSASVRTKSYFISAHPYLFDTFFRALRWCGFGEVVLKDIYGGVNKASALVEADQQGYLALKGVGFAIEKVKPSTPDKPRVRKKAAAR